jgi:leucyl aminopeptidase
MKKHGMGALLSVTAGSVEPAKLIVMQYAGAAKSKAPVALIGKGVTFDSGGISLKPGPAMDEMKFDMCGAASVLGCMKAISTLKLKLNVIGIVPACENLPSGIATKPGDIVTSMSGKTIEVLNTDAEGRLILCDALTYAQKKYKPGVIVDIATLTGACLVALGRVRSGLLANSDRLANALLKSGEAADDPAWRLPLGPEYSDLLQSNFADMANVGGRDAGTITAACFLAKFVEDVDWAHLDIAGTAYLTGQKKGATGRPIPLLLEYLTKHA